MQIIYILYENVIYKSLTEHNFSVHPNKTFKVVRARGDNVPYPLGCCVPNPKDSLPPAPTPRACTIIFFLQITPFPSLAKYNSLSPSLTILSFPISTLYSFVALRKKGANHWLKPNSKANIQT